METTLQGRMKEYEEVTNFSLTKKTPVILRLDGKNFSTFTKGLDKPFDKDLNSIMEYTCIKLKEKLDNVKFIYSQSDEISILLTDWDKDKEENGGRVDCYYDYRIQKIVSVASSIATTAFNSYIENIIEKYTKLQDVNKVILWKSKKYKANFDARIFNIPLDEVNNYFIYRQKDCYKNAISNLAITIFTHKELQNKSTEERIKMIKEKTGIDVNTLPKYQMYGFGVFYKEEDIDGKKIWDIEENIPNFTDQKEYITQFI